MSRKAPELPLATAPAASSGNGAGRPASISRDDLIDAAMRLVGPHRSISTLSLREVTRQAGIAPNSFYRHFRDTDELAVALIDEAGSALRKVIGEARKRAQSGAGISRTSVEIFMEQLNAPDGHLSLLLREGNVGSTAYKQAVDRQLRYFEEELREDLVRLAVQHERPLYEPGLAARAITRMVFTMGAAALDMPKDRYQEAIEQTTIMVRMILIGSETMAARKALPD